MPLQLPFRDMHAMAFLCMHTRMHVCMRACMTCSKHIIRTHIYIYIREVYMRNARRLATASGLARFGPTELVAWPLPVQARGAPKLHSPLSC